jgi:hypothetical protein
MFTGRHFTRQVLSRAGAIGLIALLATTAACSGGEDSASSATPGGAPAAVAGGDQSLTGGSAGAPTETASDTGTSPAPADRKLIIRITVGVEVDDVAAAVDQVVALAKQHGGELSASTMDLSDPRFAGGDLVFRVPPAETDAFIAALDPGIGRRTSLQTATEDVTLKVTDLASRIETARASLDRVRALLTDAKNIGEVITLEGELTQRQNALDELLSEKTYLDGQVAMSTVTVHLLASGTAPKTADDGIGAAFARGWHDFVAFLGGVVKFIGYTLPFLVLFGVGGAIAWWIKRRVARRNRSIVPPPPPVPAEDQRTSGPDSAGAARTP